MKRLQSKVAIVTASTRGIGFELAPPVQRGRQRCHQLPQQTPCTRQSTRSASKASWSKARRATLAAPPTGRSC